MPSEMNYKLLVKIKV